MYLRQSHGLIATALLCIFNVTNTPIYSSLKGFYRCLIGWFPPLGGIKNSKISEIITLKDEFKMEGILKELTIVISSEMAFEKFVGQLNAWWPKEYTWSQDALQFIKIDARIGGLCTEIGPNGFRCDWGTVTDIIENERIRLKWQIGPKREPIPNAEMASDLRVNFIGRDDVTTLILEHYNFENHGDGFDLYKEMMDSKQGWDYILECFKVYCEN